MGVRSQGWEDPLEEGLATHSSILAWRIPWTEEPSGLQSVESPEAGQARVQILLACEMIEGEESCLFGFCMCCRNTANL